jgi:acyl-CoA synthetase (AMP-forming)/AMP-acid ligase II
VDRKKELIKVRGFQVAPPELENVLLTHPLIIDAAVIGVPSSHGIKVMEERGGERPRAYVVKRPGPDGDALTPADVKAFCAMRLARYKELTGGVVFVTAIPKNATGKFLKGILREWAKKELELDPEGTEMEKVKARL